MEALSKHCRAVHIQVACRASHRGHDITELESAQLPRALADTSIAVINMNYALEAQLKPSTDALALEAGKDNPYANVLAVRKGRETDPAIQKLAQLLTSPEVKQFIEQHYQGTVLPAF